MILLVVTLAQWAAGWLVLGRLRRCGPSQSRSTNPKIEVGTKKARPFDALERRSPTWLVGGEDLPTGRVGDRRSNRQVQGTKVHPIAEVAAPHEPRSAGVPPAGSPSVSHGVGNGGETPPEPAAEEGRGTVAVAQLSIIIPARNEEGNLPRLLGSLAAQSVRPGEIIVVDDGSTDRTAEVARQNGARVLASQALPAGWRGKTWACHQGAQAAVGQWLLFLDADTWFEPEGLARALAEFPAAGAGALALVPYHAVRNFHEQFSGFFNLVLLAGTGAFTFLGDGYRWRGLPGQFLLLDRVTYQRAGGHEVVKGRILENFWFSKQLQNLQVPMRCGSGRGVFSFRMYPEGWRQLVEGWTKGFASGAGQTPLLLLLLIIAWLGGLFFAPIGVFVCGAPWLWLALYGLCVAQVGWLLRGAGTFHWIASLVYPALLGFFFTVFARSVWRSGKIVSWKGREIRAD